MASSDGLVSAGLAAWPGACLADMEYLYISLPVVMALIDIILGGPLSEVLK